jgi:hypothetical protein
MLLCCALAAGAAYGLALAEERIRQQLAGLPPVSWALAVTGLGVAILLVTGSLYLLVNLVRAAGWLRAVVLISSTVGLLWLPTALVAGALDAGPFAAVYGRLGEPQAGRWAAAALGLAGWLVLGGVASRRSIETGRSWMRVDGLEFRRRLVRVVAGWPAAVAVATLAFAAGWARNPLFLMWIAATVATLQLRTR